MAKVRLGKLADVPPGRSRTFPYAGKKVLVCNVNGAIAAYENFCPHMGGAMSYDGKKIQCSWHGACFTAAKGEAISGIAEGSALTPFIVTIEGEDLYLETDSIPKSPWANDF